MMPVIVIAAVFGAATGIESALGGPIPKVWDGDLRDAGYLVCWERKGYPLTAEGRRRFRCTLGPIPPDPKDEEARG